LGALATSQEEFHAPGENKDWEVVEDAERLMYTLSLFFWGLESLGLTGRIGGLPGIESRCGWVFQLAMCFLDFDRSISRFGPGVSHLDFALCCSKLKLMVLIVHSG
jgi:hypothetical protein